MKTINISAVFGTATSVDPALILDLLYSASRDGVLCIEGIPYDDELGSYRCIMSESWGREDEAVAVYKVTEGDINEAAPLAEECKLRTSRLAKLTLLGSPDIVIENERFLLTVARILNCYADEVEPVEMKES